MAWQRSVPPSEASCSHRFYSGVTITATKEMKTSGQMKAIVCEENGGPEVMQYVDRQIPEPGESELLIKIEAAGVNFIDVYVRTGLYKSTGFPIVLGRELAGEVVRFGSKVDASELGLQLGDRVCFFGESSGGYAQYATVRASRAVKVPSDMNSKIAASIPLQGMTAHYLTHSTYPISKGDLILIHAGAGGTGRLLIAMAKIRGATVITTVSNSLKAKIAKDAGADHVILYSECKFDEEVMRITQGAGVHCVYDSVGKSTWEQSLKCLRPRGHLVLFGNASGAVPPVDPLSLMRQGSITLTRPSLKDYIQTREELLERMKDLFDWVSNSSISVIVGQEYPLSQAAQAHQDLESRRTTAKLILIPPS